ncbi:hypothetical protein FGO68_gene15331 [Halteria grandinella]|uniref:Transmembrane protein n=1 Tax=Halteria grandinella TaxID=5974 RepID=A0A8J8NFR8_HALGN|nr:hypothetical protein FGO68_gene15331 [Halteria grandinella]
MILNDISRDDEQQSFISTTDKEQTISVEMNLKQQIKMLPPIYLSMSLIVLSAAILSQFQYARAQTFPLFLELPFQKNQLFTVYYLINYILQIGNALISLIGIIIYYLVYQANQQKPNKKRYSLRSLQYRPFSFQIFLSGVISHLSFLAFALLPMEQKNQSNFLCIYIFIQYFSSYFRYGRQNSVDIFICNELCVYQLLHVLPTKQLKQIESPLTLILKLISESCLIYSNLLPFYSMQDNIQFKSYV